MRRSGIQTPGNRVAPPWTRRTRPLIACGASVCALLTGSFYALAGPSAPTQPTGIISGDASVVVSASGLTAGNRSDASPPANQTSGADVLSWVERYENAGPDPARITITEAWSAERQRYVPGSLASPDGWQNEWSTDSGASWTNVEPADPASVNATRTRSVDLVPGNRLPGSVKEFDAPSTRSSFSLAGSGEDSFALTFYRDNVYSIGHHTQPEFPCFSKRTGAPCGVPRAAGSGLEDGWKADSWVDQSNGRAYVPAQRGNVALLACVDLDDGTDCGEIAVFDNSKSVGQPWQSNGRVYFFIGSVGESTYRVACAVLSTRLPCAGQPYALGVTPAPGIDFDYLAVFATPDQVNPYRTDGRILYTAPRNKAVVLECFDTSTNTACAGFTERSWGNSWAPIVRATPAETFEGLCGRFDKSGPVTCYDAFGKPLPVSAAFNAWMPQGSSWAERLGKAAVSTMSGSRTLLSTLTSGSSSFSCFDWALDTACANFPALANQRLDTYSLRADPFIPGCVWEDGHKGIVVSFNALTGALGCGENPRLSMSVRPVYCARGVATRWRSLRLVGMSTFGSMSVTIGDASGVALPGWSGRLVTPAAPTLDLSALPILGSTAALTIDVELRRHDPAAWEKTPPGVEVTWSGDPFETCRRTTAVSLCTSSGTTLLTDFVSGQTSALTENINGSHTRVVNRALDYVRNDGCGTPGVAIRGRLNGIDASVPPGVKVAAGSTLAWTYEVTNTGATALGDISVIDDAETPGDLSDDVSALYSSGDTNGNAILEVGEVWAFTRNGVSLLGQHMSSAIVTAAPYDVGLGLIVGLTPVTARTTSAYIGYDSLLQMAISLYAGYDGGGVCSISNDYLATRSGAALTYCYVVTNIGTSTLTNVHIVDPALGIDETDMTIITGAYGSLDPSRTVVAYYETTNTGPLVNTARSSATPIVGPEPTAEATAARALITGILVNPPT